MEYIPPLNAGTMRDLVARNPGKAKKVPQKRGTHLDTAFWNAWTKNEPPHFGEATLLNLSLAPLHVASQTLPVAQTGGLILTLHSGMHGQKMSPPISGRPPS